MALTPVEIRHLQLRRGLSRLPARSSVDRLLEEIAASFEDVWRERADLADRVEQLEADLVRHQELEALLRTTLVSAERAAQRAARAGAQGGGARSSPRRTPRPARSPAARSAERERLETRAAPDQVAAPLALDSVDEAGRGRPASRVGEADGRDPPADLLAATILGAWRRRRLACGSASRPARRAGPASSAGTATPGRCASRRRPERGNANDAVLALLAETLAVPRASVVARLGRRLARQDRRAGRDRAGRDRATARHGERTGGPDEHRHRPLPRASSRSSAPALQRDDRAPRHRRRVARGRDRRAASRRAPTTTWPTRPRETLRPRARRGARGGRARPAPRRSRRRSPGSRRATYGTCDVCGKEIPVERLEAVPWTTLCIDDARKRRAVSEPARRRSRGRSTSASARRRTRCGRCSPPSARSAPGARQWVGARARSPVAAVGGRPADEAGRRAGARARRGGPDRRPASRSTTSTTPGSRSASSRARRRS